MRVCKGARTLRDVQANIAKAQEKAKGLSADVYLTLSEYFAVLMPEIEKVRQLGGYSPRNELVLEDAMDVTPLKPEMHLAYYNEIDPFASEWLIELMQAKLIPTGFVDTRDIRDISPEDLEPYTQCHFFAGTGGWALALRNSGWRDEWPIWTGSCPCQPFSAAGAGAGFSDDRHLWPAWFKLTRVCRPAILLGEQVEAAIRHGWLDLVQADLEGIGYSVGAADFPACSVGAPHKRNRLYFGAYNNRERRDGESVCLLSGETRQAGAEASGSSTVGFGAYAQHAERRAEHEIDRHAYRGNGRGRRGDAGVGSDSHMSSSTRLGKHSGACSREEGIRPGFSGAGGAVGGSNTCGTRLQEQPGERGILCATMERDARESANRTGATRGFWANCDWWYGRDGKYRPIEPGLFPLAHGVRSGVGHRSDSRVPQIESSGEIDPQNTPEARVMRLRGYGNAIVVPQAIEFIKAFMGAVTDLEEASQ